MSAKKNAGFSLLEILVTLTVMVTLLTFMVVSLRSSQTRSRDEERKIDIINLTRGLESYYDKGDSARGVTAGHYPSSVEITNAISGNYLTKNYLPGTPASSFVDPNNPPGNNFYFDAAQAGGEYTDAYAASKLSTTPYLYTPLTRTNTFCTAWANCSKFILYYVTETDNIVRKVRSKNQ